MTTLIRGAKGLTSDLYVPRNMMGNTMTALKASSKFKRKAKLKRQQQQEATEEKLLNAAGSFFGMHHDAANSAESAAAAAAVAAAAPAAPAPASSVATARFISPPSMKADNTKLEGQVEALTVQMGQLTGMMQQIIDNQAGAANGGLAFRMP